MHSPDFVVYSSGTVSIDETCVTKRGDPFKQLFISWNCYRCTSEVSERDTELSKIRLKKKVESKSAVRLNVTAERISANAFTMKAARNPTH